MHKNKILSLILSSILIFTACQIDTDKSPQITYKVTNLNVQSERTDLFLTINRTDSPFKQVNGMSRSNLPSQILIEELKIKSNTDPSIEFICDITTIPHKCTVNNPDDQYSLSAQFADGITLEKGIEVPGVLGLPEIEILAPVEESEDKSILEFTDLNFEIYTVELAACYQLECLSGTYLAQKTEGEWQISQNLLQYYAEISAIGDRIKIDFEFDPDLYKKVSYTVNARSEVQNFAGTTVTEEISKTVSFE